MGLQGNFRELEKSNSLKELIFGIQTVNQKRINLNSIEWKTVTTGGSSSVDIWVTEEAFLKNLILENNFKDIKLNLKDIDKSPIQYDFGGMDIRLVIETLPEKLIECSVNESLPIKLISNKQARIYVKVIQEDGHQAWSSPMYIKKVNNIN